MSILDGMRRVFGRARAGASDMAHGAGIRLDLRNLEGRRDHLFRSIGKRAYALFEDGHGIAEFDAVCAQLRDVERSIAAKREELDQTKGAAKDRQTATQAPT